MTPEPPVPPARERLGQNGAGRAPGPGNPNFPGSTPPRGTFEAADILVHEGYFVGLMRGRDAAFDIVGHSPEGTLLVRIVRPKAPVANAREVRELYEKDIRAIQPFCRTPSDNVQFWVFSRETGLLRYRVFDWGIGNVTTMQKILKNKNNSASDTKSATTGQAIQRARNSPCPEYQTG